MKTLENLVKAFAGESMARNRYQLYAKIAKEEGYIFVSKVFLETAENEKEHAETLFKLIQKLRRGESIKTEVKTSMVCGDTVENLKAAIDGEHHENTIMYPEFAEIAENEGLNDIAGKLRAIAKAEEHHERRYRKILEAIENGTMFKRDEEVEWVCLECGYIFKGTEPPEKCPSCGHPKGYYVATDMLSL
ncbi:rubrerythrin [Methanotorris igneus]|uniref:Rubrerythrin n=1 Tax=Methanotorris igneus (strain DSM 5666 / JCM 11834 / Kol 5) TaxID=880724 RepID=F6BAH6_METIK|nr:rubrerythrin family protein [Methanotorris igneus]AEF96989.1 Rubrerythrin [Methanotorris igneus Kol 5]